MSLQALTAKLTGRCCPIPRFEAAGVRHKRGSAKTCALSLGERGVLSRSASSSGVSRLLVSNWSFVDRGR